MMRAELQAAEDASRREFAARRQKAVRSKDSIDDIIKAASSSKKKKKKKKSKKNGGAEAWRKLLSPSPVDENSAAAAEDAPESNPADASTPVLAFEDAAVVRRLLRRDVSRIASADVSDRKKALKNILLVLFPEAKEAGATDGYKAALNELFEDVMKPLLKRLADSSEACRELAATLLCKFAEVVADLARFLPYFYPAIMERCSQQFAIDFEHKKVIRDADLYDAVKRGKISTPSRQRRSVQAYSC